jgi:exopolysaccharide production protein ExoQ
MGYINHSHAEPVLQVGRPPWLVFLFLAAVIFLIYHDLSYSRRGIGNYNLSQDDLITNMAGVSIVRRIALLSLGIFAVFNLVRHPANHRLRIDGPLAWVLLSFTVWAFISPIWAADSTLTLKRLVVLGLLWGAVLAVVRRFSLSDIILWTFSSSALFLFIGIFAEVLFGTFRPFTSGYRFAGSLHPNGQGIECGLLLLSAVAAADVEKRRRAFFWAWAFVGFIFLLLTGSRTALSMTLLALAVYLAAVHSRKSKVVVGCGLSIFTCFLLLFVGGGVVPGLKSVILLGRDDPGTVDSFNGRAMIWEDVGYYIRERPILGYGYDGFWTPDRISVISDREKWGVPNAPLGLRRIYIDVRGSGTGCIFVLTVCGHLACISPS